MSGRLITAQCPCCRFTGDFDVFLIADEPRIALIAAVDASATVAAFFKPMNLYVRLFGEVGEQMPYKMMTRLYIEITQLMNKPHVTHKGMDYKVTPSIWQHAFDTVREAKNLNLPLTNHSYLLGVVGNLAAAAAGKAEQRIERQRKAGTEREIPESRQATRLPTAEEKQKAIEAKAKIDALYGRNGAKTI